MLALIAHQVGRAPGGLAPRLPRLAARRRDRGGGGRDRADGVTHAILTRIEPAPRRWPRSPSRGPRSSGLGRPRAFAYPNGDASPGSRRRWPRPGFQLAVITDGEPIPGCPQFALRRKNLAEGSSRGASGFSSAVFACEVLGLLDALPRPRTEAEMKPLGAGGAAGGAEAETARGAVEAVVFDGDTRAALAVVRSLGRRGVRITVVASRIRSLAGTRPAMPRTASSSGSGA